MRINRLLLENFGLFAGTNSIDLISRDRYQHKCPIILIGGMNGTGKTTLLEALQLALYGKEILGLKVRQKDYEEFLRSRMHKDREGHLQKNRSCVGVEFDFVAEGVKHHYSVNRSWIADVEKNGAIKETLEVLRNGVALDEVAASYWQDFVRELIPPGVAQFFFFDGEKIQRLADEENDEYLTESIKVLLGLDLIERLQSDLKIYRERQIKRDGKDNISRIIEKENNNIKQLKNQLVELHREKADLVTLLDGIRCGIKDRELNFSRQGGRFAERREALKEQKAHLKGNIEQNEKRIRELTEGALPFAYCPQLCHRLIKSMRNEKVYNENDVFFNRSIKVLKRVEEQLLKKERHEGAEYSQESIHYFLKTLRNEIDIENPQSTINIIHGYSEKQLNLLCNWLERESSKASSELQQLCANLEQAIRQMQDIEHQLGQIPEDELLKPMMNDLADRYRRQSEAEHNLARIEEDEGRIRNELGQSERNLQKFTHTQEDIDKRKGKLDLLSRCRSALKQYQEKLILSKIEILQKEIGYCLKQLMRKDDLIFNIIINPDDFSITLVDRNGRKLRKKQLSAGEKQVYAVAVLWGLARTSGRPLPMVIDTPLGRLDSAHRSNLVDYYFPSASHQIIILSTDTEIDQQFFRSLEQDISHSFRLEYDNENGRSLFMPGYFWKNGESYNGQPEYTTGKV